MFKIKPYSVNYIYKAADEPAGDVPEADAATSAVHTETDEIGLLMTKSVPEGATLQIQYMKLLGDGYPANMAETRTHDEATGVTTVDLSEEEWSDLNVQMPNVGELPSVVSTFGRSRVLYHRRLSVTRGNNTQEELVWASFAGAANGELRENPKVYYTQDNKAYLVTFTSKHKPLETTRFSNNWGMLNYDGITAAFNIAISNESEFASETGGPAPDRPMASSQGEVDSQPEATNQPSAGAEQAPVKYYKWGGDERIFAMLLCGQMDGETENYGTANSGYLYQYSTDPNETIGINSGGAENLLERSGARGSNWKWVMVYLGDHTKNSPRGYYEHFRKGDPKWPVQTSREFWNANNWQRPHGGYPLPGPWNSKQEIELPSGLSAFDIGCSAAAAETASRNQPAVEEDTIPLEEGQEPAEQPAEQSAVEEDTIPLEEGQEPAEQPAEQSEIDPSWAAYISETASKWYSGDEVPESVPTQVATTWAEWAERWGKTSSYDDWKLWYREQHLREDRERGKYWRHGMTLEEIQAHNQGKSRRGKKGYMRPEDAIAEMKTAPAAENAPAQNSPADDYLESNVWDKRKFSSLAPELARLADHLDSKGHLEEASYIDGILKELS